jgi:hypothetical protein
VDAMKGSVLRAVVCSAILAWPGMAQAHSPIAGIGVFYNALLHPLIVPHHALVLVGLSLALGQQGRPAARLGLLVLWVAFAVGLGAAMAGMALAPQDRGLLFLAAVVGASVTIAAHLPRWLIGTASLAAGLMLGLDSAPDPASQHDTVLSVAGLCSGIALTSTVIAGTCLTLHKAWMQIGIRIMGSWIAAASVLVLALLFQSGRPSAVVSTAFPTRVETAG